MAEEKTQKVFVRLVKGFPEGVTHRRGGVALTAGPTPVEAEVTKEQLEAIEGDANVEVVSSKAAEAQVKHDESAPEHPTAAELAESNQTGRNYESSTETSSTASKTAPSSKAGKKG